MAEHYDRAVTVFSPNGHILQLDYAQKAVEAGRPVVGVRGNDIVVLVAEKTIINSLQVDRINWKIAPVDDYTMMGFAGLTADARVLTHKAQSEAADFQQYCEERPEVMYMTMYIAALLQRYTHYNGVRPFGVGFLIAGFEDDKPRLFEIDPSGVYQEWKAHAIGRSAKKITDFLIKKYNPTAIKDDTATIKLGIRAIMEVVQPEPNNLQVAVLSGDCKVDFLDNELITDFVEEIMGEQSKKK